LTLPVSNSAVCLLLLFSEMLTIISSLTGGCGQAFEVVIVSEQFQGKNKLFRHRLVNKALQAEIQSIHAFTQVCLVFISFDDVPSIANWISNRNHIPPKNGKNFRSNELPSHRHACQPTQLHDCS